MKKQIALHNSKIANPTNYIKDWSNLDPRQQFALINKKWPADIKRQMEQKDILQSIINEMK